MISDGSGSPGTRTHIEASLGHFLADATGNDTVLVFLASHGLSDARGNYYFVPQDARYADIDAVQHGAGSAESLIRWEYFVDRLRETAGWRVLIVDTCASGSAAGNFDVHSLAKRSLSSSFALVAASRADEESQEYTPGQHGLFTFNFLEAIQSGYDPNHDGVVSLSEAFEYAFDKVQERRNKALGRQTPQLNAPQVLLNMPIVETRTEHPSVARLAVR